MSKLTEDEKNEMKRLKAIPNKEMKVTLEQFNKFLKTEERDTVKIDKSKGRTLENFVDVINAIIEENKVEIIPIEVVEFYNQYLVDDNDEKPANKPPAKKDKKVKAKKEKDVNGFIIGSTANLVYELLSTTPRKMTDVKKELGNSYYTLMKKYPKIFAKNKNLEWYVVGSTADIKE